MIALAGTVYGILAGLMFQRFTDAARVWRAADRMLAHMLEFRLFIDEPRTVFRAQRDLLVENGRLLRALALPMVLSGLLFLALYSPLNGYFGTAALGAGQSTVITMPIGSELKPIPGAVVETPGVRVARTRNVSWRVRAVDASNKLGHKPWMALFFVFSMAGGALQTLARVKLRPSQTIVRIRRVMPNRVRP